MILAGENGVGKSLLLDLIFRFSNYHLENEKRDEKRHFQIEASEDEFLLIKNQTEFSNSFRSEFKTYIFDVFFDFNIINNWNQISITIKDKGNKTLNVPPTIFTFASPKKCLKTIFSDVEINFTPSQIQSVTAKNIDQYKIESEKSGSNLATEITQLLIDVQSIDALEFTEWGRNNIGKMVDKSKLDTRISRFTSAFEYMFPSKRYKRIDNIENRKKVIFEEYGKEMNIENLSSGEKQIVFRGSFLLKDKLSSKGALMLIDEPEISLHPIWQTKILNYFKKLFIDDNGIQTSQIIVATHSPFIIHNVSRFDDKVIILQRDDSGKISVANSPRFHSWTPEVLIKEAFKLNSFLGNEKSIVFVEGETDEKYLKKSIQIYDKIGLNFNIEWIGRKNEQGDAENTGAPALNNAKKFYLANMNSVLTKNKVVLLYDSDKNVKEETIDKLLVRKMSINPNNNFYKIGIENLLELPNNFDNHKYYKHKIKTDKYGASSTISELDKTSLCSFICDELDSNQQKDVLKNVIIEIDKLSETLK